ncbi:MAG: class I SAM-dependent methyltransferase [Chloroflexi bacterium]|nr:class I SAM-dependent methyltransferase [Chloroflexota bacterium]
MAEAEPYSAFATVYDGAGYTRFSQNMIGIIQGIMARQKVTPHRLLDLACGTGVAAVAFARLGYEVVGVDRSEAMLAHARARADGVPITFLCQDMRDLALPQPVDLAICLFDSLNYLLEPGDLLRAFHRVAETLTPGGLFLFDMNTRYGLAERWGTVQRVQADTEDFFLVGKTEFDYEADIAILTLTGFVREGETFRRFTEVHGERAYPLATIEAGLREAGLSVLEIHGLMTPTPGAALQLEPPHRETGRVLFLAQRPA